MRPRSPFSFVFAMAVALVAISLPSPSPAALGQEHGHDDHAAADEQAIHERNAAMSAAVAAGDLDAIVAFWAEDAILMPPNAPALEGMAAIRPFIEGMMATGVGSMEFSSDELTVHGDTAYEVGRYVMEATDGAHLDHGKYIVIWKRTAAGWKAWRDIFNSDMAPAGS